jgi:hypothetical protein
VRVVPGSFLRVGEDLVCGLDFCEEFCRVLDVAIVAVGVELECFAAVCFLDAVIWSVAVVVAGQRGTYASSLAWRSTPSSS